MCFCDCWLSVVVSYFNSVLASGDFCHQLMTFVNSLNPDQELKNVSLIVFLKERFEKSLLKLTPLAGGKFCNMLVTFGNSLDPDQGQQTLSEEDKTARLARKELRAKS